MRLTLPALTCTLLFLSSPAWAQDAAGIAAAAATPGSLEVVVDRPGARVFLDGNPTAPPPFHVDGVTPGPHTLRVEVDGQAPLVRELDVRPGATLVLDLVLAPVPAAPAPAPPPPAPAPVAAEKPAAPGVRGALKDVGAAVWADLPLAGAGVLGTVGLFLVTAVLWTTEFSELPGAERSPVKPTANQWHAARWVALAGTAAVGAVTLLALLWPTTALGKLVNVVDSMRGDNP